MNQFFVVFLFGPLRDFLSDLSVKNHRLIQLAGRSLSAVLVKKVLVMCRRFKGMT